MLDEAEAEGWSQKELRRRVAQAKVNARFMGGSPSLAISSPKAGRWTQARKAAQKVKDVAEPPELGGRHEFGRAGRSAFLSDEIQANG